MVAEVEVGRVLFGFREPRSAVHSGDTFGLGDHTITASATDAHGNTSSETFSITVQDTTAPTLTTVAGQTADATNAAQNVATVFAEANNAGDGTHKGVFKEGTTGVHPGGTFCLGESHITAASNDAHG